MTLYEISGAYQQVLEWADDPEVDQQTVMDTLEGIEGDLADKADSYIIVAKELEAEVAKYKAEIDRLTARMSTAGNNVRRIKERLIQAMTETGLTRLQTTHFKLSIAKNGGVAPLEITGDVPAEYCRMEPDNAKIREALKARELDFAKLGERGVHLNVR